MPTSFQERAWYWALKCFGVDTSKWNSTRERCNRFIEEALELCQSLNMSREDAHMIVDYVYNRPVGKPQQEVGGVMVTLAVLCKTQDIDMEIAGDVELDRCWAKIDVIRQTQATKKADSALPQEVERCNCDASCGENRYHDKGTSGCQYHVKLGVEECICNGNEPHPSGIPGCVNEQVG